MQRQVFCNPIGLGIDTAKTLPAAQTLQLDAEQLAAGCKLDLRFVLFQKVSSIALFFPANHEGRLSVIAAEIGCATQCVSLFDAPQAASALSLNGWLCMA